MYFGCLYIILDLFFMFVCVCSYLVHDLCVVMYVVSLLCMPVCSPFVLPCHLTKLIINKTKWL